MVVPAALRINHALVVEEVVVVDRDRRDADAARRERAQNGIALLRGVPLPQERISEVVRALQPGRDHVPALLNIRDVVLGRDGPEIAVGEAVIADRVPGLNDGVNEAAILIRDRLPDHEHGCRDFVLAKSRQHPRDGVALLIDGQVSRVGKWQIVEGNRHLLRLLSAGRSRKRQERDAYAECSCSSAVTHETMLRHQPVGARRM